jgi:hypothetical protein
MDGQRFDGLTRRLSAGISRRGAVKALSSLALAGVTARLASRGAAANTGGCLDYGFACSIGECCSPYTCRAGNPTSICGYCLEHSAFCTYGDECCSGSCEFSLRRLWWVCQKDNDHKKKKRKKKKHGNGNGHGNNHGHD